MRILLCKVKKQMRQVFYAVDNGHIVPCHLIAHKDRDSRGKYAANSKRDKRRFQTAYDNYDDALAEAAKIQEYKSQPDTF